MITFEKLQLAEEMITQLAAHQDIFAPKKIMI